MTEKQRKIIERRELHKAVFLAVMQGGYAASDSHRDLVEDALHCADIAAREYRYPGDEE